MSAQGLEIIDKSAQAAHEWINTLASRLGSDDKRRTLRLLRETLHALRDVLAHDEAAHLAAQLPTFLRGVFYEGWRPSSTPVRDRSRAAFVARVAERCEAEAGIPLDDDVAEVFRMLELQIAPGEMDDIRSALRAEFAPFFAASQG